MSFEEYVVSSGERLRRGFTTGTCAALAAQAATRMLLLGEDVVEASLMTPAGVPVTVALHASARKNDCAVASVIKDAGDDFDVTDGTEVRVRVERCERGILIDGGQGVGRVTCAGLDQPVGNAAINSGPRAMIATEVQRVMDEADYLGGISVLVEVPQGAELGKKTFNPSLGITGGISILGSSGIVEPRSLKALQDSLKVEIHVRAAAGSKRLVVTPGNYGQAFLKTMGLPEDIPIVSCANFIGFTLDQAVEEGFSQVLLVGHIGKLVKVAGAVMDTHSRMADCRREIFAAHAAAAGASQQTVLDIFDAMTTDACLDILEAQGLKDVVVERIAQAIQQKLDHRVGDALEIGAVIFSNKSGLLASTAEADELMQSWR